MKQEGEGTSSCPDSWYSPIAIEKWLDREGWPVPLTNQVRAHLPAFLASHFQRALEKGWQLRNSTTEALERQLAEAQACSECAVEQRLKANADRDALQVLLAEANERSQREFHNVEAWHAKWTEQEAKLEEAYTNVSQLQGALLAADGATVQAVGGCDALQAKLEQAREEAEAGKDLAGWAAAIKWNHQERNTAEWLAGLRVRVEKVQDLAALDAGKEAGG